MDALNIPLEMIAACGTDGSLRPVRFRLTAEDQSLVTVRIRAIKSVREIRYVGIEAIQYVCTAELGGRERLFELRYTVRPHCWTLCRFLDGGAA